MEKRFENTGKLLRIPVQKGVCEKELILVLNGKEYGFKAPLAEDRIEDWYIFEVPEAPEAVLKCAETNFFLEAAELISEDDGFMYEDLRPLFHMTPFSGKVTAVYGEKDISFRAGPFVTAVSSKDDVHMTYATVPEREEPISGGKDPLYYGNIKDVYRVRKDGREISFALSEERDFLGAPFRNVFSLMNEERDGGLIWPEAINKLRIWKREWMIENISKEFFFESRFTTRPAPWPNIEVMEKKMDIDDITAKSMEYEIELFVGQERFISFDVSGTEFVYDALLYTLKSGEHSIPVKVKDGRLNLHVFFDRCVTEIYTSEGKVMMLVKEDGPGTVTHRISSETVENINNDSFSYTYFRDPYIRITTEGTTSSIIRLVAYGLRSTRYSPDNERKIRMLNKGELIYHTDNYDIYENEVTDRAYGERDAYVLDGGKKVISFQRAVEEFDWRQTPWGDMTRITNRSENFNVGKAYEEYPVLTTHNPVIDAAYNIATDILFRNSDSEYNLPGQEGLFNAALFQGKGEGFGVWIRDTCHAAIRTQNLLKPETIKKSLRYILCHGFNNGEDSSAMPAIAIWDYYLSTLDRSFLYEAYPYLKRFITDPDKRFKEARGLVEAWMCPAQDAFPEEESGGFCIGTEILYAKMYESMANMALELGTDSVLAEEWNKKAEIIHKTVREDYFNGEIFTMGPKGSEAYEKAIFEATGAELSLWSRFGIADEDQKRSFLKVIGEHLSDFGLNWYPFRKEKNHFWRACWVSWTLGIAEAAGKTGDLEMLDRLIYGQVRNALFNKTFHEVIDADTGLAWRWPGLPWHASAYIGYIIYGALGLSYGKEGLSIDPHIPYSLRDMSLKGLKFRGSSIDISVTGWGNDVTVKVNGKESDGRIEDKKNEIIIEVICR